MMILALIGAKALYLLFAWLLSAALGGWLSERRGYGERLGLAAGLLLSAAGLLIVLLVVLLLPSRPGAAWTYPGLLGRRRDGGAS